MTNNLDLLILILPYSFALHNLEEIFGMEKWTKSIPSFIHAPVTTRQFSIAVGLFTILGFVLILTKNYYCWRNNWNNTGIRISKNWKSD